MKISVTCDFCGTVFERYPSQLKAKRHFFCCKKCLADYSNKKTNPGSYAELKDMERLGNNLAELNRVLNPTRMTPQVRAKIRVACLNTGEGKTYPKFHGRREHRTIAEWMLGRSFIAGEVVHHIDGDKLNTPDGTKRTAKEVMPNEVCSVALPAVLY